MDNIKNKKEKQQNSVPDGQVGIRTTLNKMGFSDDKIGYNEKTGTVTLDGKDFMKPSYMDEAAGRSYAPKSEIQRSVVDFYKNSSDPVVRVSDAYAAKAGDLGLSADSLSYGNGTVMIGGVPLNTLYIDDYGKAWARQSDVDKLTSGLAERTGVKSPNSVLELYNNRYMSDIWNKLNDIANRKDFSYNPDDDPVYAAYKQKYLTEGDRASKNAMANYSALTGGYTNSAAVTAGAQANQYYAKKLSDVIPQLASDAYDRYSDKYQTDLNLVAQMLDAYDSAYQKASAANNQTRKNVTASSSSVVQRDKDAFDREQTANKSDWENLFNKQKYDSGQRDSFWNEIFNTQKRSENNLENNARVLNNEQQKIYLEYYRSLLDAELEESRANAVKNRSNAEKSIAEARARYGYGY